MPGDCEIRIHFEGHPSLRSGFDAFFSEVKASANQARCRLRFIAAGGNPERDFGIALRKHPGAWNILLRDSEGPLQPDHPLSLCTRHGWPPSVANSIFWMVEMMESWFHADKEALQNFYGHGFRKDALKANPEVQKISKQDLKNGLSAATRHTKKGDYYRNKTVHAAALLARIKPAAVQAAAPNCRKLFEAILQAVRDR